MVGSFYLHSLFRRAVAACFVLVLICAASHNSQAQESTEIHNDTARAIKLYEAGKVKPAINLLQTIVDKRQDDAVAWLYLGRAQKDEGNFRIAVPALRRYLSLRPTDGEAHVLLASILVMGGNIRNAGDLARRAIELGVQNAEVHYVLGESNLEAGKAAKALEESGAALTIDSGCVDTLLTKARALYELNREREAIDALTGFLGAKPNADDVELWREELARWQSELQTPQKSISVSVIPGQTPNSTRARILHKPSPEYSEKARNLGVVGTVKLSVVFSSTGVVTDVRVLSWLPGGLTTEAVKVARQITFEPAQVDGKPVPQTIRLEYNFNIY